MAVTRRELLASFLGVPFAVAACRQGSGRLPPLPPGELVGAAERVGHAIRDHRGAWPAAPRQQRTGVAIVGGGVAGLAAAWRLRRRGFTDFTLLELEDAPGGTARSGVAAGGLAHPWGAHYIAAPMRDNHALLALLGELGVLDGEDPDTGQPRVAEEHLVRDPEERLFYKGRWTEGLYLHAGESADDVAQLGRFHDVVAGWVRWRDARGRRAFAIPTGTASDDAEVTALDRLSAAAWLDESGFTSPRLRWFVDYACRDDYGATAELCSAWAALHYFAARILAPGDESQPLVTWPEGNGRLVAHLYGAVRDKVQLGVGVAEITTTGAAGCAVLGVDAGGPVVGLTAEQVIFAAPQFVARRVIRGREQVGQEFRYGAWMVANLTVSDRPSSRGYPLAWDNVLYESPALGYVVATHQRGIDRGPTVLTYYYPVTDEDPRVSRTRLYEAGRDEWAEVVFADLARAHPELRRITTRLDVMRWGHAMIRPEPGFQFGGARARAAAPWRGIHFANADLSGVALFEEAFAQGVRAADEVLAARGV